MQPEFSAWLDRKPAGKKPRHPLPRVTKKRAKQNREYTKVRNAYLKSHLRCEVYWSVTAMGDVGFWGTPICEGKATEIHHKAGRIGAKLTDAAHFLAVCPTCHRFIHAHPKIARANGFLLNF